MVAKITKISAITRCIEMYWALRLAFLAMRLEAMRPEAAAFEQNPDAKPVTFNILLQQDGNDSYLATIRQMPGLAIDGRYRLETVFHAIQAARAYSRSVQKHGESFATSGEEAEVVPQAPKPGTDVFSGTFWTTRTPLGVS